MGKSWLCLPICLSRWTEGPRSDLWVGNFRPLYYAAELFTEQETHEFPSFSGGLQPPGLQDENMPLE